MTPKEKAKELISKYSKIKVTLIGCKEDEHGGYNPCIIRGKMVGKTDAKKCALIAAELAQQECDSLRNPFDVQFKHIDSPIQNAFERGEFWDAVKKEIENYNP